MLRILAACFAVAAITGCAGLPVAVGNSYYCSVITVEPCLQLGAAGDCQSCPTALVR